MDTSSAIRGSRELGRILIPAQGLVTGILIAVFLIDLGEPFN